MVRAGRLWWILRLVTVFTPVTVTGFLKGVQYYVE
jgi:hypothetical protein